jgi:WS/DGAT/MGAT family acyltransferase
LAVAADPAGSIDQLRRTVRGLRGVLADAQQSPVRDPLIGSTSGLSRRLDILRVPMSRLLDVKQSLGVTLNDVVLTALAGCIGAYHRQRHVYAETLNCMVPMNLRLARDREQLGNRVGMFNVSLPVGVPSAEQRLRQIVAQTHAAKTDRRGAAYPFLVGALTLMPGFAFSWLAQQALGRVNLACTNVPGLQERRYLAGAEVEAIYPFASVVQGTPLVVALLSYAGGMDIGIDTDPEAIPDPHRIAEHFDHALHELERLAVRHSVALAG